MQPRLARHPSNPECESLFAYTLGSRAWVPVDRAGKPELVRSADAWIDAGATETLRRIRERIPRISDAMYRARGAKDLIEALRLTDVARPAASDLLALMDAIASEAAEAGVVSRDAELAARWVQRTLDDILSSEQAPHPQPGQVRLLASHNGALGFVPGPVGCQYSALCCELGFLRDCREDPSLLLNAFK